LDDSVLGLLDGIGRTHFSAGWTIAMHADRRHRRDRILAIDELQVDHGMPTMRFAFGARVHARFAADAARRINEESVI
jgi:hypothetical protein